MALTVLCVAFVIFLLLGVPVAFAIGLSCLATFAAEGLPFETAIQMMVSGMNVFSFLAIPFFIFSGELMLHGGIADKIVSFARSLVGHWKGGLGLANVVASTLFGGVSGSPVADTSAMGGVMIPIMKKEGYSAAYAVNVTTHASLSGALMPTSHNMIIYAFAAQAATGMIGEHVIRGVSIGDLMFAGAHPRVLDHAVHADRRLLASC
jgi:tripartite ATP-independent transporter DctM subunit